MIDKLLVPLGGLKKEPFYGSHEGMRYCIQKETDENDGDALVISVILYPEPWSLPKTPKEHLIKKTFPFDEDGLDAAFSWMQNMYDEKKEIWNDSRDRTMETVLFSKWAPGEDDR